MKQFVINNIEILFKNFDNDINENMAKSALEYAEEHKEFPAAIISKITVTKDKDNNAIFDVNYNDNDQPKITRIRRITGYLTGSTDRWNNAKRDELTDRVTHIG